MTTYEKRRILTLPHWFNPVAWYAANRFDELAEHLCDHEAFTGKREGIAEFARTLLLLHENAPTRFVARQSIFGRDLKGRIAFLTNDTPLPGISTMKKSLLIFGTIAILLVSLFRVEFVTTITAQETKEPEQSVVADSTEDSTPVFPPLKIQTVSITTDNPFGPRAYPEGFAEQVANLEKEVKENDGLALVARIVDADGNPVRRIDYHVGSWFWLSDDDAFSSFPNVTRDGWLRTNNLLNSAMGRGVTTFIKGGGGTVSEGDKFIDRDVIKFVVYTATHKPAVIKIPVKFGSVYYADIKLERTPEDELVTISGIALVEDTDAPIEGATVFLRIAGGSVTVSRGALRMPGGAGATSGLRQTATDKDGRFSFQGVAPQLYSISVRQSGYSPTALPFISLEQLEKEHVFRFYKLRSIEIEYVFQPDGNRDFTAGNLQPRTVTLQHALNSGFRFESGDMSTGAAGTPDGRRDIDFRDSNGNMNFHQVYNTATGNGFYDAGEVPFESVKEADANPGVYPNSIEPLPVKRNHVYVVKTIDGKYAKFVVRKILVE